MEVPWSGSQCIVCLQTKPLTLEHVIPEALGGRLVCRFLCKSCNSSLGHQLEGKARTDPMVRLLVAKLSPRIPKLSSRLVESQTYVTVGPGPRSKGHIKNGEFVVNAKRLEDGSLIQQTTTATKAMKKLLAKDGENEQAIIQALHRFAEAPENTKVSLGARYEAVKWSIAGLQPTLDGPMLDPVVAVKSAYEFLALHLGTAIQEQTVPLKAIRQSLREGKLDARYVEVERLHAPEAMPFHGLLFEGNLPYAKVQVRLFGQLTFRVHFKQLSVGGSRGMYTHDLETNQEHVHQLPTNDG